MRTASLALIGLLALGASGGGAMAQGYGGPRYDDDRGPPPRYGDRDDYGPRRGYGPPPPPQRDYGPPPPRGGGDVCAYENGFCNFRGYATVRYGARGSYVSRQARDGIPCNNRVFGDPAPGLPKRCILDD